MERAKKKKYNSKIMENEHGTFTPLIFSTNGGMGREAKVFLSSSIGIDLRQIRSFLFRNNGLGKAQDQI